MTRNVFLTIAAILMAVGLVAFAGGQALASDIQVVTPADMKGWVFFEEVPNATGEMVNGPGAPPINSGSANFTVDATGRELLLTGAYVGTRLDAITKLEYSTYQNPASTASDILAASLQFDMDYDLTDGDTSWQGRLVFEPYYTQTVVKGVWQTWNTIDPALELTAGNWWASGAPGNAQCPISNPCTWNEVKTAFPDAGLRDAVGALQFKAGGPWPGYDGNVDAFTIGVSGVDTTYDFELSIPVGGTTELLVNSGDAPASAAEGSGSSGVLYAALVGGIAAAAVAVGAGGWYARRRFLR